MRHLLWYCQLILAFLLIYTANAKNGVSYRVTHFGTDCTQIKAFSPRATSGVYVIQPVRGKTPFKVFCEMRSDGGWTVFQRRTSGKLSFHRKWAAYSKGFGNERHDHWLGLKKVALLTRTKNKKWTLRVDLWDHDNRTAFAEYKNFHLGNQRDQYKLHVGRYSGTAGDALRDQNNYGFSTIDRDNDGCSPCIFGDIAQKECTFSDGGGWWYSSCGSASLNGDWHRAGDHIGWASGLHWKTWKKPNPYSMRATRMMMKSA
ncbi:angiopoietin-related protein 5-like isoform X2 [Cheilinus undulatus]|uniref:angiopoietin-related protein 5-like isoform X2 n=1 Tax=Cheilinus undulatus TaxID=241271 RepID=UPI001BD236B0|nr:angiopoietin-related protein 5-like isoform X2 [Cheilinus undulatus]